ncbi:MAG: FAD-dependent oxidoreductase, partial [Thermomicrobiales bacterium]
MNEAIGPPPAQADVVVYGATASGVVAAVAAAHLGRRVIVVEPGQHIGGMVSGGLGWTDVGDRDVIGGLARDFYARVAQHYGVALWDVLGPEPHVAERIFRDWLVEAGVAIHFGARLDRVERAGRAIRRLLVEDGRAFAAAVFIDASYEGELLARAGVSYAIGRESVGLHGESWAGRQPIRPDKHNFDAPVSPFVSGNDGPLLPLLHDRPLVPEGTGDGGVQSYCFRLCLTDRPENRRPFPRPEGYDPAQYELLRRYLAAAGSRVELGLLLGLKGRLPNGKVDVNSIGPISTNLLDGSNWAYPDANYTRRAEIWQHHLRYTQGLLYFLAHDPGVPAPMRAEMSRWGLCRDEFADTGGWPHQLYIREARRMRGEYFLTQADLEDCREKYDTIGLGAYNIDIREVQRIMMRVPRFPQMTGETFNEGYLSVPVRPYAIPYRALAPRYHECDNLLAPICVSASHVAFSSLRMEPQYMILGHAAGVAAALAVQAGVAVQRVDIVTL